MSLFGDSEISYVEVLTDFEEEVDSLEASKNWASQQEQQNELPSPPAVPSEIDPIVLDMPRKQPEAQQPFADAAGVTILTRTAAKAAAEFAAGPSRSTRQRGNSTSQPPLGIPTRQTQQPATKAASQPNNKRKSQQQLPSPSKQAAKASKKAKTSANIDPAAADDVDENQDALLNDVVDDNNPPPIIAEAQDTIVEAEENTMPLKRKRPSRGGTTSATPTIADSIFKSPTPPRKQPNNNDNKASNTQEDATVEVAPLPEPAVAAAQVQLPVTRGRKSLSPPGKKKSEVTTSPRKSPRKIAADAADNNSNKKEVNATGAEPEVWWNALDDEKVSLARDVLQVSGHATGSIPLCRERQAGVITTWLNTHLKSGTGGSLYVSGPPGTGKSLTVAELLRQCKETESSGGVGARALISVNCMSLTDPRQVVLRILAGCRAAKLQTATGGRRAKAGGGRKNAKGKTGASTATDEKNQQGPVWITAGDESDAMLCGLGGSDPLELLKKEVVRPSSKNSTKTTSAASNGLIVVMLDELDGLLGSGRVSDEILGDLFALAHCERSELVLIGIANSIDLVQQLTKPGGILYTRGITPGHVIFPSYLRIEIAKLLTQRVESLPGPVFHANAIEFCARKVANGNGDMRRALQACSQALEGLIAEAKNTHTTTNDDDGDNNTTIDQAAVAPAMVGMRQMAAALNKVTGGVGLGNENVVAIRGLPVPQQLLLCVLSEATASAATAGKTKPASGGGHASKFITMKRPGAKSNQSDLLTLGALADTHTTLCRKIGVVPFALNELATVADVLQDLGLLKLHRVGSGRAGSHWDRRQWLAALNVPADDVVMALADVPVVKDVLAKQALKY